jgi:hypothetical protein
LTPSGLDQANAGARANFSAKFLCLLHFIIFGKLFNPAFGLWALAGFVHGKTKIVTYTPSSNLHI